MALPFGRRLQKWHGQQESEALWRNFRQLDNGLGAHTVDRGKFRANRVVSAERTVYDGFRRHPIRNRTFAASFRDVEASREIRSADGAQEFGVAADHELVAGPG